MKPLHFLLSWPHSFVRCGAVPLRAQMSQADLLTRIDRLESGAARAHRHGGAVAVSQSAARAAAARPAGRDPELAPGRPRRRRHSRRHARRTIYATACRGSARAGHRHGAAAGAYRNRSRRLRRQDGVVAAMHLIRRSIRLHPARHVRSAPARQRPNRRRRFADCTTRRIRSAPARRAARSFQRLRAAATACRAAPRRAVHAAAATE